MKTTKLINGKTFDEVFAERGEETTANQDNGRSLHPMLAAAAVYLVKI